MDKKATLSALVIGVIIGCASSQAGEIATVNAEPTTAAPAPGQYQKCVVFLLDTVDEVDELDEEAKTITGWTPLAGTGQNGVVLCR